MARRVTRAARPSAAPPPEPVPGRPRVILHSSISLDGRIRGFPVDLALHYRLASRWQEDATLVGSDTLLAAMGGVPPETGQESPVEPPMPGDPRPLLVVPDSRGRVRGWHHWQRQPFWRDILVLVIPPTPEWYLADLRQRGIGYCVTGGQRVDLRVALAELFRRGIRTIRVDAGGTLGGILLREGLADELSLLLHPALVGNASPLTFFADAPPAREAAAAAGFRGDPRPSPIPLRLVQVRRTRQQYVWLIYAVDRPPVGETVAAPPVMERTDRMATLLLSLLLLAERLEVGRPGEDFLVLPEESLGYQWTPLEREFAGQAETLAGHLRDHPGELTAAHLQLLLQILGKADHAADGYRARLQSQAGDYGDEESAVGLAAGRLLEEVGRALTTLDREGVFPLREVPVEILTRVLVLRNANGGWSSPVWKRFYSRDLATFRAPPFTGFFAGLHADLRARIGSFAGAEDWQKRSLIRSVAHDGCFNDASARDLSREFLRSLVENPDREIRLEALSAMASQGEESADLLIERLGHPDAVTRRLAAFHLGELAAGGASAEFRARVVAAVAPMLEDPDEKNRETAREATRQAAP